MFIALKLSWMEMDERADSTPSTFTLFCEWQNKFSPWNIHPQMVWMSNICCTLLNTMKSLPTIVEAKGGSLNTTSQWNSNLKNFLRESFELSSVWSLINEARTGIKDNWLVIKEDSEKNSVWLQRCRRHYLFSTPTSAWSTLILLSIVLRSSRISGESWLACAMVYFLSGITFCLNRGGLSSRRYANTEERNFF